MRSSVRRFEDLVASYRFEEARGIPMSVRERYERRLSDLRVVLRDRRNQKRLGEVLQRMGAVDEAQISNALAVQHAEAGQRLLGEILTDLGLVDEQTIRRALEVQTRTAESKAAFGGGA